MLDDVAIWFRICCQFWTGKLILYSWLLFMNLQKVVFHYYKELITEIWQSDNRILIGQKSHYAHGVKWIYSINQQYKCKNDPNLDRLSRLKLPFPWNKKKSSYVVRGICTYQLFLYFVNHNVFGIEEHRLSGAAPWWVPATVVATKGWLLCWWGTQFSLLTDNDSNKRDF